MSCPHEISRPNAKPDLYSRVTNAIIAELENGVRPWTKPWSAEHLAGRISRPLRSTGEPYSGINVILLWAEATARGFTAPIWTTFRQALALGGHVRKGEHGSTVVYANRITRTESGDNGQDVERQIPFLKAYTVFNVDQVEGLPPTSTRSRSPSSTPPNGSITPTPFSRRPAPTSGTAAVRLTTRSPTTFRCRPSNASKTRRPTTRPWPTNAPTGPGIRPGSTGISAASAGATTATPAKSWSRNWAPRSSAPTWAWSYSPGPITRATSPAGWKC